MHFSYIVTVLAATAAALPSFQSVNQRRDTLVTRDQLRSIVARTVDSPSKEKREAMSLLLSREPKLAAAVRSLTLATEAMKRDNVIANIGTTVHDLDTLVADLVSGVSTVTVTFVKDLDTVVCDLETLVTGLAKEVLEGFLDVAVELVNEIEKAVYKLEKVVAQIDNLVNKKITPELFGALNAALAELQALVAKL